MNAAQHATPAIGSATTVLCLHSSASSARQWTPLVTALADSYRVIAPDLIGYGAGSRPECPRALTLDEEARRIEPLLAMSQSAVHLVGHSFGGAVALQIALRNPGRVASITLYEPVLFTLLDGEHRLRAESHEIRGVRAAVREALWRDEPESAAQLFVDYWSGLGSWRALPAHRRESIVVRMPKVNAEFDALFGSSPPASAYRRIVAPVQLIVGTLTRRPPRAVAARLAAVLPVVTRVEIAGAGHMGPLTHPDAVNAHIRAHLDTTAPAAQIAQAA
jgi:pimeloyl-ACP methyl ester carboxylesterase